MNNKLSFSLNIVLLVAVAVLYYLHFSNFGATYSSQQSGDSSQTEKPIVLMPKDIKNSKVVYVNIDVVNEKYEMLKDFSKDVLSQQQRLESTYQAKAQKLQQEYEEMQQKASQGLLSENQSLAAQKDLMTKKEDFR